ncbi:hypothetical protein [Streptomyces sp. NPDC048295]|uniref:hypothetical protein n=1 Tax=Streptomyces sp. NPDC048295 TaxID=3154617 RepID=UPI00342967B9
MRLRVIGPEGAYRASRCGCRFTAGDAALARFYQRQGFTIHSAGEPVFLTGGSKHTGVGASPLPGEQMFSRLL